MASSSQRVLFFASQVAAVTGRHPYQKQHAAFEAVWRRFHPTSLQKALDRAGRLSDEELLQRELASAPPEVASVLRGLESKPDREPERIKADLAALADPRQCSPMLQEHAQKVAFGGYGTSREGRALDLLTERHGVQTSPLGGMFYSAHPDGGWMVGGRVDAMAEDGGVVEVKCRMTAIRPGSPPGYDLIQLQTYLHIHARAHGYLFEVLHSPDGPMTHLTTLQRDEAAWQETARALGGVAALVRRCAGEGALADAYVASKQKTRWLRRTMQQET